MPRLIVRHCHLPFPWLQRGPSASPWSTGLLLKHWSIIVRLQSTSAVAILAPVCSQGFSTPRSSLVSILLHILPRSPRVPQSPAPHQIRSHHPNLSHSWTVTAIPWSAQTTVHLSYSSPSSTVTKLASGLHHIAWHCLVTLLALQSRVAL